MAGLSKKKGAALAKVKTSNKTKPEADKSTAKRHAHAVKSTGISLNAVHKLSKRGGVTSLAAPCKQFAKDDVDKTFMPLLVKYMLLFKGDKTERLTLDHFVQAMAEIGLVVVGFDTANPSNKANILQPGRIKLSDYKHKQEKKRERYLALHGVPEPEKEKVAKKKKASTEGKEKKKKVVAAPAADVVMKEQEEEEEEEEEAVAEGEAEAEGEEEEEEEEQVETKAAEVAEVAV